MVASIPVERIEEERLNTALNTANRAWSEHPVHAGGWTEEISALDAERPHLSFPPNIRIDSRWDALTCRYKRAYVAPFLLQSLKELVAQGEQSRATLQQASTSFLDAAKEALPANMADENKDDAIRALLKKGVENARITRPALTADNSFARLPIISDADMLALQAARADFFRLVPVTQEGKGKETLTKAAEVAKNHLTDLIAACLPSSLGEAQRHEQASRLSETVEAHAASRTHPQYDAETLQTAILDIQRPILRDAYTALFNAAKIEESTAYLAFQDAVYFVLNPTHHQSSADSALWARAKAMADDVISRAQRGETHDTILAAVKEALPASFLPRLEAAQESPPIQAINDSLANYIAALQHPTPAGSFVARNEARQGNGVSNTRA